MGDLRAERLVIRCLMRDLWGVGGFVCGGSRLMLDGRSFVYTGCLEKDVQRINGFLFVEKVRLNIDNLQIVAAYLYKVDRHPKNKGEITF